VGENDVKVASRPGLFFPHTGKAADINGRGMTGSEVAIAGVTLLMERGKGDRNIVEMRL